MNLSTAAVASDPGHRVQVGQNPWEHRQHSHDEPHDQLRGAHSSGPPGDIVLTTLPHLRLKAAVATLEHCKHGCHAEDDCAYERKARRPEETLDSSEAPLARR